MGNARSSKIPPLARDDLRVVLSYTLREEHLRKFLRIFREIDEHFTGVWSCQDLYTLIQEPRISVRGPIIDAIFFMGDRMGEGMLPFSDWLVLMASFCALSREEVLHLLFIIMDVDRNGRVEKHEIIHFFSYCPVGSGGEREPVFPVNNKNALDKFRKGKWTSLEFDGFSQLCEQFPYIAYPAYHTQELFRTALLGKKFWENFNLERAKAASVGRRRKVPVPGTGGKEQIEVKIPNRCTMQEMLDYSRRTTDVNHGKRVQSKTGAGKNTSKLQKAKDEEIANCPILMMIRNPLCMYHIPAPSDEDNSDLLDSAGKNKNQFELPAPDVDTVAHSNIFGDGEETRFEVEQGGLLTKMSKRSFSNVGNEGGAPASGAGGGVPGLEDDDSESEEEEGSESEEDSEGGDESDEEEDGNGQRASGRPALANGATA